MHYKALLVAMNLLHVPDTSTSHICTSRAAAAYPSPTVPTPTPPMPLPMPMPLPIPSLTPDWPPYIPRFTPIPPPGPTLSSPTNSSASSPPLFSPSPSPPLSICFFCVQSGLSPEFVMLSDILTLNRFAKPSSCAHRRLSPTPTLSFSFHTRIIPLPNNAHARAPMQDTRPPMTLPVLPDRARACRDGEGRRRCRAQDLWPFPSSLPRFFFPFSFPIDRPPRGPANLVKIFPAARAENIPPAAGGVDAQRGTAQRQDYHEVHEIDAQLAAAAVAASLSSAKATGEEELQDRLARVNERNRKANAESIRKAEMLEAERKKRERKSMREGGGVVAERFPLGATETERGNAPEAREWLPDTAEVDVERSSEVEPDTDLEALDPETALTRRCASLSSFDAELPPSVGVLFAVVGLENNHALKNELSPKQPHIPPSLPHRQPALNARSSTAPMPLTMPCRTYVAGAACGSSSCAESSPDPRCACGLYVMGAKGESGANSDSHDSAEEEKEGKGAD
ncbi:hypothetical protein DFH08DRAFT_1038166 [Mycena albidolilacea]|uniref:Uncharacterized protein n=1 Tax=Mycena albidolilacea TaxID=1033008 RepID=A0AAD7AHZ1_9AGAR|nr:hypothetical protein DFH08DRAFT_1038166 [Mycena albidolilacea]